MNEKGRKRLAAISEELGKAGGSFEHLIAELTEMQEDEQEKFDNMSEGLQQGEKGQNIQAAAEALETAAGKAQEAFDALDEAAGELTNIA